MAFKMNRPSVTQGTSAHKSAMKDIRPGGKVHSHGTTAHSQKTSLTPGGMNKTVQTNHDGKGNRTQELVDGVVEKETEENSKDKANKENTKRLRTQEKEQDGNEMSGVNSGVKKKDDSPLDKKNKKNGLKRGLNKKYRTKSRRDSHNREAELGNKKLNRLNAKYVKRVNKKGIDQAERSTLYVRQGKQLKKAIDKSSYNDHKEYKRRTDNAETKTAERKANKENDAILKEEKKEGVVFQKHGKAKK